MNDQVSPRQEHDSISTSRLHRFKPNPDWFAKEPHGIHGIGHEARVVIWGQVLSVLVADEGMTVDADAIGWAAAIHDTQRWDDGGDPGHGARAAKWIRKNPRILPREVNLETVAYLCKWHFPSDHMAPEMTPELMVFKDADALDRWRIGDLDSRYFRTAAAGTLLTESEALWRATCDCLDPNAMFSRVTSAFDALRKDSPRFAASRSASASAMPQDAASREAPRPSEGTTGS